MSKVTRRVENKFLSREDRAFLGDLSARAEDLKNFLCESDYSIELTSTPNPTRSFTKKYI